MPEHDTFDLDAAFARLEQDIAGISAPRGAGAAIATARRRRRTAIGGAVAGLALVVGTLAVSQGIASRNESIGPAQLPSPAPLDAAALSAATEGWVSDWGPVDTPGQFKNRGAHGPRCLGAMGKDFDKPAAQSTGAGGAGLLVGRGGESMSSFAQWSADHPNASRMVYAAVVASVDACPQVTSDRQYLWEGAQAHSWTIRVGGQETQQLWMARADNAVGFLWIGGSAGRAPEDVVQRVASAFVAGLEDPKSFH
jgi:hypothetical protein